MEKTCKGASFDDLKKYLQYTEVLWKEYNTLLSNSKRILISEEIITQFSEIMSYDETVFFDNLIQMYDLSEDGFLAFDFMGGDTLRGYRFKIIINGIEYFKWYLKYLKIEISKNTFEEKNLLSLIDSILESASTLSNVFEDLLQKENAEIPTFERRFENIYTLIKEFCNYCQKKVDLINI